MPETKLKPCQANKEISILLCIIIASCVVIFWVIIIILFAEGLI